jgi:hypothetical protein
VSSSHFLIHNIRKHWRNTVYSNVWIAFCAGCVVLQTELLLDVEISWVLSLFGFFSTVFLYNYQRAVKLRGKPSYSIPGRNTWMVKNRTAIFYWALLGGIATLLTMMFLNVRDLLVLAIPGGLSFLYVLNVFRLKGRKLALRDLPYLKIYLIALSWTALSVWLPMSYHETDYLSWSTMALMSAEKFLFILAITIPFDIRDLKYDDRLQHTIPQLMGVNGARYLSAILAICSLGCTISLWYFEVYDFTAMISLMISIVLTVVILLLVSESRKELFFTGLVDGTIALQFCLVALSYWLFSSF